MVYCSSLVVRLIGKIGVCDLEKSIKLLFKDSFLYPLSKVVKCLNERGKNNVKENIRW